MKKGATKSKGASILSPNPQFMENLQTFIRSQFPSGDDSLLVYERFRGEFERIVQEEKLKQTVKVDEQMDLD